MIGDIVEFDDKEGIIESINSRKNFLNRPLLSNIDYIGILFSIVQPKFDINLFQRMILNSYSQSISMIFIISKIDLVSKEELKKFLEYIEITFSNKIKIFPISTKKGIGLEELKNYILGKNLTITGPSGVGKSTLINSLLGEEILITKEVSNKTLRGRHTTTESRFFRASSGGFLIDTPGFSSLNYPELKEKKELEKLFPEFLEYTSNCKFRNCIHVNEPNCSIKENVNNGNISKERYKFYLDALNNIFS